ncbi:MAG TPA: G/U mismatch-specific DNA glycosylase [Acidimicrobiales bacterium]|nr:G/U mismatch-specific DNA glycosylase [Acidimicrobiales bacterium]
MSPARARPTPEELEAAVSKSVPDVIGPDLDVLFCGINPSLWSGAVGHHFARPGNRFWKALDQAGFTPTLLDPSEENRLLEFSVGVTNIVNKATRAATDLQPEQLRAGTLRLEANARQWHPRVVALLGIGAYRTAFRRPRAELGLQPEHLGPSRLWVLANPSGLQARYQLADIVEQLTELRSFVAAL